MTKRRLEIILFIMTIAVICITVFVGCNNNSSSSVDKTLPCTVLYTASNGGKLRIGEDTNLKEKISQSVKYGENAEKVTAIPNEGYYFVKWSDGLTDYERQDKNIIKELQISAEFAEITVPVNVSYQIVGNGYIYGKTVQTVQSGTDAQPVEARLYDNSLQGEIFVRWSDGNTNSVRQDKNIVEDKEIYAEFGYSVNYRVDGEGSIIGKISQAVVYGTHAESVIAIPKEGYRFVEWSDGLKTAMRQDKWVNSAVDVYAIFEWRDTDDFIYHYNYATNNYNEDSLTLTRGEVDTVTAIVPERDFFTFDGWYLDENFTSKAIDENGNNLLGEEIFNSPSRDLYAKWNVKDEYVVTYKILMVYITEINGLFVGNDGQIVDVHYQMAEEVKRQCIELTKRFSDTLNDMLDGLVRFEINSYFTTKSVDEKCFCNEKKSISIYANQIPELNDNGILEDYRSVITIYSFDGEENLLPDWSGMSEKKYSAIPIDRKIKRHGSLEQVINADYEDDSIGTFVHEFIHTIEQGITCYEYHMAYHLEIPNYISDKLYLLNQWACGATGVNQNDLKNIWKNSEKGGIPYSVWSNHIFTVNIDSECINGLPDGFGGVDYIDTGGYVLFYNPDNPDGWRQHSNDYNIQKVPQGSRTTWLFAEAKLGYKFLYWSDGEVDPLRIITNVEEDITLIAYFERLSYTVEYIASEGGRIDGELSQTLLTGERTTYVTAIADEGYRFIGWSDGCTDSYRSDIVGQNVYDEKGNLYYRLGFSVTALFEKI